MINYYTEQDFILAKRQRNFNLGIFLAVLFLYLALSAGMLAWYLLLPINSPVVTTIKLIQYPASGAFVIFSFLFMGIKYKRVNKYYKMMRNIKIGLTESDTGNFVECDDTKEIKDGVEFKSLVFLVWNKRKQDYFERKVLVFYERPFPEIPERAEVSFITHANVLMSYEILDNGVEATEETEQ